MCQLHKITNKKFSKYLVQIFITYTQELKWMELRVTIQRMLLQEGFLVVGVVHIPMGFCIDANLPNFTTKTERDENLEQ